MSSRGGLLMPFIIVGVLLLASTLVACDKGPETDLYLNRVVISFRWDDDPPRFRGIDPKGKEYLIYVTDETEINSSQEEAIRWDDIILGDDLAVWANKVAEPSGELYEEYTAVRMDIAPTTR